MEEAEAVLGQNIRRIREAAGLSQAHVADAMVDAGVSGFYPQTVLKVEKGTRTLKFSEGIELAKVLGVEPSDLHRVTPQALVDRDARDVGLALQGAWNRLIRAIQDHDQWRAHVRAKSMDDQVSPEVREALAERLRTQTLQSALEVVDEEQAEERERHGQHPEA